MRVRGISYAQISSKLGLAKSTLSYWFSNKPWSKSITQNLNDHWKKISSKRISNLNSQRKVERELHYEQIRNQAKKEFFQLMTSPLFLVGLSLYWGEGDKVHKGRVSAINSDPKLLKLIVNFYLKILKVSPDKIRVGMFIYSDHQENNVKQFWINELGISEKQFIKTQILPSRSHNTKRRVNHGVCSVYFSSTEIRIKIQEWIKILPQISGISSMVE